MHPFAMLVTGVSVLAILFLLWHMWDEWDTNQRCNKALPKMKAESWNVQWPDEQEEEKEQKH